MKLLNKHLKKTIIFTGLALIAFAANSVLCRLALEDKSIDASSFTVIRLMSGTIVLLIIISFNRSKTRLVSKGSWYSSLMLFLYAVTFSFAYTSLDTGTGALILYGSIQVTMVILSLISGGRLHTIEWGGLAVSFAGFICLIIPGVTAPSTTGFFLMSVAGVAWGIYTLKGLSSKDSLADTTYNFVRTIPFVITLAIITIESAHYSFEGILFAALSGGIASGIGYTIWYIALQGLSAIQAAVFQLMVPVIAAFGGVMFISELVTVRLIVASIMILGGVLMIVLGRYSFTRLQSSNKTHNK